VSNEIDVECRPAGDGWQCHVRVGSDRDATEHEVGVSRAELESLAPGAGDPTHLVASSFELLLEREPREAILRRFELSVIERYFPGYRREIGSRL